MKYTSFDPEAKVIGQAMLGFHAAVDKKIIEPILHKHNLASIQPDQWYPLQKWLDVLGDIDKNENRIANMLAFVDIGRKVAKSVYLPEEIEQTIRGLGEYGFIEFALKYGTAAYVRDHQGNAGQFTVEKITDRHVKYTLITPYPHDFWYGVIHGFATRFCTTPFLIKYEDLSMRNREYGQPVIIHVVINQ